MARKECRIRNAPLHEDVLASALRDLRALRGGSSLLLSLGYDMARPDYTLIDHTADIGVEVRADTIEKLFEAAAFAFFDVQVRTDRILPDRALTIEAEGDDPVGLMVAWLSELQYRFEVDGLVFAQFRVQDVSETSLRAECRGEPFDLKRHDSLALVKAITYHQAVVEPRDGGWFARLIFDV